MDAYEDISRMIDHALLRPDTTMEQFEQGCRLAATYRVGSVCIQPHYLQRCRELLQGSGVRASTVIGFPHGGQHTSTRLAEAKQALKDGGEELDLVCNISRVVSGDWDYVRDDLAAIIELTHAAAQKVKVIFENCFLTDDAKIRLCELCSELNADWVKTSTGFGTGGATAADVSLMRKHAALNVQVKAAGGVRDLQTLLQYKALGVTRIGTSSTTTILNAHRQQLQLPPLAHTGSGDSAGY